MGNRTGLTITLKEDSHLVDEVVVVGYGTQKKVNLTGSVEAVSGKDLAKTPCYEYDVCTSRNGIRSNGDFNFRTAG